MNDNEMNPAREDVEQTSPETAETPEGVETPAAEADEGKLKGGDKKRLKKAEAELAETKKKLEAAEAALAEEKDKYLRMLAEYDNFRRRTAKEKETIYGDAAADTVKGLLPVIDTLERAAAGLSPEDAESPLGKGITMTLKSAADALVKLGVEEVPTDVFNPDIHNAVMHIEDESLGEGAIVAVFQKGYRKGDHIIRYAMVQVAN
jgi:molecular chaperone GrpE